MPRLLRCLPPGKMLNGRPIYVALAQPKEVRQATLQQQFALRMVQGIGPAGAPLGPAGIPGAPGAPPPGMFPGAAPMFYAPPGMIPGGPGPAGRQGMMYQPMMPQRGGWGAGGRGMAPNPRPGFQPMPPYNVSVISHKTLNLKGFPHALDSLLLASNLLCALCCCCPVDMCISLGPFADGFVN